MYECFSKEDDIKLWCEAKGKENCGKRSNENREDEPKSKRERNDDIEAEIRAQLEEKHTSKYTGPVYILYGQNSSEVGAIRATMIPHPSL